MKKIFWLFLFSIFCLLIIFSCRIDYYYNASRIKLDGKNAELLSLLLRADTKYAEGYSDSKFLAVKIGMKKERVLKILRAPLSVWHPYGMNTPLKRNYTGFEYSTSPSSRSYRIRQINFDGDHVAEVVHYFYID